MGESLTTWRMAIRKVVLRHGPGFAGLGICVLLLGFAASASAYRDATPEEAAAIMAKPPPAAYPFEWEYIHVSTLGPWAKAGIAGSIPGEGVSRAYAVYRGSGINWEFVWEGSDGYACSTGMPVAVQRDLGFLKCQKPHGTSRRTTVAPFCDADQQAKRPHKMVLACGDGGLWASRLRWERWGGRRAVARGQIFVKTCDPDCATGGVSKHRGKVALSRPVHCGGHHFEYSFSRTKYGSKVYTFPLATC
jgi:hypothetical protein